MVQKNSFDTSVALPHGLTIVSIRKTIEYLERELAEFVELYVEQANLFSGLVGLYAVRGLSANSVYERPRHLDIAQQRFPDLKKKGSGERPSPRQSLECKASKRPWSIQSHYNHPGWYVVWRYLVDPTCSLESKCPLIIWRVDVIYLESEDWKYEGSKAGSGQGGRTHTFGLKRPAERLKGKAVYHRDDVIVSGGKAIPRNGH